MPFSLSASLLVFRKRWCYVFIVFHHNAFPNLTRILLILLFFKLKLFLKYLEFSNLSCYSWCLIPLWLDMKQNSILVKCLNVVIILLRHRQCFTPLLWCKFSYLSLGLSCDHSWHSLDTYLTFTCKCFPGPLGYCPFLRGSFFAILMKIRFIYLILFVFLYLRRRNHCPITGDEYFFLFLFCELYQVNFCIWQKVRVQICFWHIDIQLWQHQLLRRSFLYQSMVLAPSLGINWPWMF